ncbi:MAG: hypothetical protein B7X86_14370 [Sphingobacteriales bacterium 17-39-43]|uniref:hypothetical protein n=1 Tax=Daejeonella sp. TaxID=2805397 RepID=UPI000BD031D1|nr:hypothetical protein [Daejeonella sp.]OYZ30133.1 MAG: hypothetical protein B7Y24_14135 [Sphingobacteriales bacterium 16-39-50]OZA22851.1 MAG: hypothetical protein B7X86_14370 [Sphingobacteriales bacterium 17-39-43]HQT23997.1 hypothetical protein [Daejeonella sp.]HQT58661.1 hypothetical protein [Daejeonella sp.]
MLQTTTNLNELKQQYNAAKPFANGDLAPRLGKYLIQAVGSQSVGAFSDVPIANGLWSPTLDCLEYGLPVTIQLVSLMLPQAIGPVIQRKEEFLGRTIEVNYGMTKELPEEHSCSSIYVVNWRFIN